MTVQKICADNRKARFNYFIEDTLEAGIMLAGSEVKALREGKAVIGDAYAAFEAGELYLYNAHIPEYRGANRFNHEPLRKRKLLVHRRELDKLHKAIERSGYTIVPLKAYFNEKGRAKIELGVARGKKIHDKRETVKERNWDRERARLLRAKG